MWYKIVGIKGRRKEGNQIECEQFTTKDADPLVQIQTYHEWSTVVRFDVIMCVCYFVCESERERGRVILNYILQTK